MQVSVRAEARAIGLRAMREAAAQRLQDQQCQQAQRLLQVLARLRPDLLQLTLHLTG